MLKVVQNYNMMNTFYVTVIRKLLQGRSVESATVTQTDDVAVSVKEP